VADSTWSECDDPQVMPLNVKAVPLIREIATPSFHMR
jgi:hypothetical protein